MTTDKEIENNIQEESDAKIYEVGFHIVPTTAEENVASVVNEVRNSIEGLKGVIVSEGVPSEIKLSYPISNIVANKKSTFDSAYFGWIKFLVSPENIVKIKGSMEKNPNIFRFLIINTVKEDVTYNKPATKTRKVEKADKPLKEEDKKEVKKEEISEEEVDKAIEELVVE